MQERHGEKYYFKDVVNNAMITEDYVSFEIAKLLKEKGFDEPTLWFYFGDGTRYKAHKTLNEDWYRRPTLQMAIKWLRNIHNILLVIDYDYECTNTSYCFKIYRLGKNGKPSSVSIKGVSFDKNNNPTEHIVGYRDYERSRKEYATYEEAEEAGLMYVLENLI